MPKFNWCTPLGIVMWNEQSGHYTWYVQRRYIQITSSRWRLEHYTFQRNKHALFSVADSQRQAELKRQGRSKDTLSPNVTSCRQIWQNPGTLVPVAVHAIGSLKPWSLALICQKRAEQEREAMWLMEGFHLLPLSWACVWTRRAEEILLLL